MDSEKLTILYLEDMEICQDRVKYALKNKYNIICATTLKGALQKFKQENPNLVLADVNLDEKDMNNEEGLNLVRIVSETSPKTPVLCISSVNYKEKAKEAGAKEFLFKREFFNNIKKYIEDYL